MGEDTDQIYETYSAILLQANYKGMSEMGLNETEEMLHEYPDIFHVKLGSDPPADMTAMGVSLKSGEAPAISNQRRYDPVQRASISTTI